jgi:signal transduction histidine kinase
LGGEYHGAMPYFFILAVIFTVFMLEGKWAIIMAAVELAVYIFICIYAWLYIPAMPEYLDEGKKLFETVFGFSVVSVALGITAFIHFRLYNEQQKKLKEQNGELEKANEQLESLNRMKTEFLQDISHEMQNPLTTITRGIGFAGSRIDKPDGVQTALDALKIAEDEAMRLGRMVASMVNLARMSGGTESREKVDFKELLVNCAEMFRLQMDNHENELNVDIDPGLPFVYGVTDQLKQVLINLLSNTVRHTRNGKVTLEALCDDGFITVRVRDTGEGIPSELMLRVFERGVSSKDSSGYGLFICQTIVEAHGGAIGIESRPGKGTTVIFTVPVYGGQSETRGESENEQHEQHEQTVNIMR